MPIAGMKPRPVEFGVIPGADPGEAMENAVNLALAHHQIGVELHILGDLKTSCFGFTSCLPCILCPHVFHASYALMFSMHPMPSCFLCILCPHVFHASYALMFSMHPMPSCLPCILCPHVCHASYALMFAMHPMPSCLPYILCPHGCLRSLA